MDAAAVCVHNRVRIAAGRRKHRLTQGLVLMISEPYNFAKAKQREDERAFFGISPG